MTSSAQADQANIELPSAEPKLKELKDELDDLITQSDYYYSRAGLYYDTRYCLWAGQSDDGRKNADDIGDAPFPWDGASDTRVRLADKLIKERKRLRKLAFWGKRVQARPILNDNAIWAAVANPLIKWLLYVQNVRMIKRELNLAWSYQDCYGSVIMGTFWARETRLKPQLVTLANLQQLAAQNPAAAEAIAMLMDPLHDEENVAMLQQFLPGVGAGDARKFLTRLRLSGEAEINVPYISKNAPRWMALRPYIDVFFDPAIDDMQSARLIAYREYLTETELRDRENTDGWDSAFIKEAIKHKGSASFTATNPRVNATITRANWRVGTLVDDVKNLIEIWHCYYKVHEDNATAMFCTVLHSEVKDLYGKHELVNYPRGEYPFDAWQQEEEERAIAESRGIPEIVLTWQGEQKLTRDFHADRMSIDVLPPLQTPKGQAGAVVMGPAQQIERKRGGEYEFLNIPPMSQTSILFGAEVEKEINGYFGRFAPDADPTMVTAARQELVNDALIDLTPVISKTFALAQQYLTDEEISMVCGRYGLAYRASHKDIQGEFDIEFAFDVRSMDPDFLKTFSEIMAGTIIPLDRGGVIDSTEVVKILLTAFDPNLAERLIRDPQEVRLADVKDEQSKLAIILTGQEPPMEQVSNPQLRLMTMQNAMQASPSVQQQLATDAVKQALWANREKMLKFALAQQTTNPQTGRYGADPVLGGDGSGMPQPGGGSGALPLGMSRLDAAAGAAIQGGNGQ